MALKWLFGVKDPSSRLLRWRLRLEEYECTIEHCKGKENTAADALSRVLVNRRMDADTLAEEMESDQPLEEHISPTASPSDLDDSLPHAVLQDPDTSDTESASIAGSEPSISHDSLSREFNAWRNRSLHVLDTEPNAHGGQWIRVFREDLRPNNDHAWLLRLKEMIEKRP